MITSISSLYGYYGSKLTIKIHPNQYLHSNRAYLLMMIGKRCHFVLSLRLKSMSSSSSKPIVGYWNIRGLAQPIRLLLAYLEVEFEDKRYSRDQNGVGLEWLEEKFNLGLDFPNLPYYIDEEIKLTQSVTILRYLGMKHKLDGSTPKESDQLKMLEQHIEDLNWEFYNITIKKDYQKLKADYVKTLEIQCKLLVDFIRSGPFVLGKQISFIDFSFYEYLIKITLFAPEVFENGKFSELRQFVKSIEGLPAIAKYISKNREPKLLNGPKYAWDGSY